jgi:hypothetical protein
MSKPKKGPRLVERLQKPGGKLDMTSQDHPGSAIPGRSKIPIPSGTTTCIEIVVWELRAVRGRW